MKTHTTHTDKIFVFTVSIKGNVIARVRQSAGFPPELKVERRKVYNMDDAVEYYTGIREAVRKFGERLDE